MDKKRSNGFVIFSRHLHNPSDIPGLNPVRDWGVIDKPRSTSFKEDDGPFIGYDNAINVFTTLLKKTLTETGLQDEGIYNKVTPAINADNPIVNMTPIAQNASGSRIDEWASGDAMDDVNVLGLLNSYKIDFNHDIRVLEALTKSEGDKAEGFVAKTESKASLFNPYYGIKRIGFVSNLPLNDDDLKGYKNGREKDLGDCSIRKLISLSSEDPKSAKDLGAQHYRISDFMYCKDLGKVSNNHMITLRRFATPIGDYIYGTSTVEGEKHPHATAPDIGRLVTFFGTEDNKLSDIMKMSFHASWREMFAGIEQMESRADSSDRGILGMAANSINPVYNNLQGQGKIGTHNFISALASKIDFGGIAWGRAGQNSQSGDNAALLTNYDRHKVYEPINTIQSNHYYEGKILFEQEFTLNFSYRLHAYNNINSKSAMLDLIGNILAVTFTKGSFWGGSRKLIGPPQNDSALKKMNKFIDEKWDDLEGFADSALNGMINWQEVMGQLSEAASNMMSQIRETVENFSLSDLGQSISKFCKEHKIGEAIKGQLKNALGRPAQYAFSSLVKGDNLGLWHVTIGNPRNPIAVMGNLIITNTEFSFTDAPLGLDDFPTEMRVAVTLKHCKPRDKRDIERMFTRGESGLYLPIGNTGYRKFYPNKSNDYSVFGGTGEGIGNNFSETT